MNIALRRRFWQHVVRFVRAIVCVHAPVIIHNTEIAFLPTKLRNARALAFVAGIPGLLPVVVNTRMQVVLYISLLRTVDEVVDEVDCVVDGRNGMEARDHGIIDTTATGFALCRPARLTKHDLLLKELLQTRRLQMDIVRYERQRCDFCRREEISRPAVVQSGSLSGHSA